MRDWRDRSWSSLQWKLSVDLKGNMKTLLLFALSAVAFSQDAKVAAPHTPVQATAPTLNTSKYWRLVAQFQSAKQASDQTPQAKAAVAADSVVQAEIQELAKVCGDGFGLALDEDKDSKTFQDIICRKSPPPAEKK